VVLALRGPGSRGVPHVIGRRQLDGVAPGDHRSGGLVYARRSLVPLMLLATPRGLVVASGVTLRASRQAASASQSVGGPQALDPHTFGRKRAIRTGPGSRVDDAVQDGLGRFDLRALRYRRPPSRIVRQAPSRHRGAH
jgi:hypothetical protein